MNGKRCSLLLRQLLLPIPIYELRLISHTNFWPFFLTTLLLLILDL